MSHLEVLNLRANRELGQNSGNDHEIQSLGGLTKLKELNMINCGLQRLPQGVSQCLHLQALRLHGNNALGQNLRNDHEMQNFRRLTKLKELGLSNCGLSVLPNDISELSNLEFLDLSDNQLKELPESLTRFLQRKVHVILTGNFLEKPPQVICNTRDCDRILRYFRDIEKFGAVHSKRLRILVVGNTTAGKTSLINGLVMGVPCLEPENVRTSGIQIRTWFPDAANEDLELDVWDYAGNESYQTLHNFYLQSGSLFLLVVDVFAYEETHESYHHHIGKWIDNLKSMVRRPVIIVAATKVDKFYELWYDFSGGYKRIKNKEADEKLKKKCCHMLENIKEQEKKDLESIDSDIKKLRESYSENMERMAKLEFWKKNQTCSAQQFS